MFAGMLIANWPGGAHRQITDTLRLVVLAALYPAALQFTAVMAAGESSFTLIPPLLARLAATMVAAAVLFKKFRGRRARGAEAAGGPRGPRRGSRRRGRRRAAAGAGTWR